MSKTSVANEIAFATSRGGIFRSFIKNYKGVYKMIENYEVYLKGKWVLGLKEIDL
jgi:hypothetical protein